MAPSGFALLCELAGASAAVAGVAAGSEGSVELPGEVVAGDPVDPMVPVGPAGAGAGAITVGLSHALNANTISTAENAIENFMRIPFNGLMKTAHLDTSAATRRPSSNIRDTRLQFRSLAHTTPLLG
jgi:hypothetical protein